MSVFDRLMITGVLWLALLLVWRRLSLIAALAERTRALERAGEELSRSNEELDRFASVVAHDLRGPLNSIGLVAQILARRAGGSPAAEGGELLASIPGEVDRMSQLIQRLLAYGRVGSGSLRPAACDCDAVLGDVTRSLAATLEGAAGTVTHDPLPAVRADAVLVSALFQNLIENAVKYRSDAPPKVHISAARAGVDVVFAVRDNGIGISAADRETVFRPFAQVKRTDSGAGVGLGLATCKRIVQRHGGRIWVEPSAGRGSTFFFTLPAARPGES
jgi:signal transduction histidine kinase